MKLKTLCWAIGLAVFGCLGMLFQYVGLPEWYRLCTAGVLICGAGGMYTTLKEEM